MVVHLQIIREGLLPGAWVTFQDMSFFNNMADRLVRWTTDGEKKDILVNEHTNRRSVALFSSAKFRE